MEAISWSHEAFHTATEFDFVLSSESEIDSVGSPYSPGNSTSSESLDSNTCTGVDCEQSKNCNFLNVDLISSKAMETNPNYLIPDILPNNLDVQNDTVYHKPLCGTYSGQSLNTPTWSKQAITNGDHFASKVKCEAPPLSPGHRLPCAFSFDHEADTRNNNINEKFHRLPSDVKINAHQPVKPTDVDFSTESISKIDSIELYHNLIMKHLVQDIICTSERLRIPTDPRVWSIEHTRIWLLDTVRQYNLPPIPEDFLQTPGGMLSLISLDAMKMCYPRGAELIHAQLNLWTTASDYNNLQSSEVEVDSKQIIQLNDSSNSHELLWSPSFRAASSQGAMSYSTCEPKEYYPQNAPNKEQILPCSFSGWNPRESSEIKLMLSPDGSDSGISTDHEDGSRGKEISWRRMGSALSFSATYYFQNNNIHLWQFLRELLDHQDKYSFCVRWLDRTQGVFKIEDSHKLAKFWGQRKNRPAMNYDKLSRSLRQYYRKGILKKTPRSQRLVYQFLPPYHVC